MTSEITPNEIYEFLQKTMHQNLEAIQNIFPKNFDKNPNNTLTIYMNFGQIDTLKIPFSQMAPKNLCPFVNIPKMTP